MEDGDDDEGLPNPELGREERENHGLDEKGDDTVDAHDGTDRLNCKAKAAGSGGRLRNTAGGDPIILEEYREKVVVAHAVVSKDAERDDYHSSFSSEDFGRVFRGE